MLGKEEKKSRLLLIAVGQKKPLCVTSLLDQHGNHLLPIPNQRFFLNYISLCMLLFSLISDLSIEVSKNLGDTFIFSVLITCRGPFKTELAYYDAHDIFKIAD